MANPDNIVLRSDKDSFLLFEEMDQNLLELRDLITEFNAFVDNIFTNHVAAFNGLVSEFEAYKLTVDERFLGTVNLDDFNVFTNSNIFESNVSLNGNTVAENLQIKKGSINDAPIGTSKPASGAFTSLTSTSLQSTGAISFQAADSLRLPIWTTLTRPPANSSMIGFNSDTGEFEGHNGVEWASVGGSRIEIDTNSNVNLYPLFVDSTSGTAKVVNVDDQNLTYNPKQAQLSTGWFLSKIDVTENTIIPDGYVAVTGMKRIADDVTVTVEDGAIWTIA